MRNTADEIGGKLMAARSQSNSSKKADNPLVAFYVIYL
jgi:hypothetical protein